MVSTEAAPSEEQVAAIVWAVLANQREVEVSSLTQLAVWKVAMRHPELEGDELRAMLQARRV